MLSKIFKPYKYQSYMIKKVIEQPEIGVFLDMGLGKTVITLTALKQLFESKSIRRVLIIAPKKVAESVWSDEIENWQHLKGLKLCKIIGDVKSRKKALSEKAALSIVSRDNIVWLVTHYGSNWPYDTVVVDELSSFKNHKSKRFIALKLVRSYIKRMIGLTGTPTSNGLLDLWSQVFLLDRGEKLFKDFNLYRDTYFEPDKRNGYTTFSYRLKKGDPLTGKNVYEKEIHENLRGLCYSMKAADYLDMPPLIENVQYYKLSEEMQEKYAIFKREQVLDFLTEMLMEKQVSPKNAAGLVNKLLQFASGAVYDDDRIWHKIHDEKLVKLDEVIEALNGRNALLFYNFVFDKENILKRYKYARHLKTKEDIADWNKGKIKMLITHPLSAGHGLNLQHGGNNIIWYSPHWSLELNQQGTTRVYRNGVSGPVTNTRIITRGTEEMTVLKSLGGKGDTQQKIMQAVKVLLDEYK